MARHVDTANTTVMTRLIQAALLTLLLQLIAQMYPSRLSRTFSNQQRSNSDAVLTWEPPPLRSPMPSGCAAAPHRPASSTMKELFPSLRSVALRPW